MVLLRGISCIPDRYNVTINRYDIGVQKFHSGDVHSERIGITCEGIVQSRHENLIHKESHDMYNILHIIQ